MGGSDLAQSSQESNLHHSSQRSVQLELLAPARVFFYFVA
jgi:hypothetical protein